MKRDTVIFALAWMLSAFTAPAQDNRPEWQLSFEAGESYVFSSFIDDVLEDQLNRSEAVTIRNASVFSVKGGFSFAPESGPGRTYPGLYQGVAAGLNLYSHSSTIGLPALVYFYQGAPVVRFNDKLSLEYEWNFGLSAGWKPCDGFTARSNLIVGSAMNAYINLGAGLRWQVRPSTSLSLFAGVTHFSDGNTSFPNPGVNQAGIRLGITHTFSHQRGISSATPFSRENTRDSIPFLKRYSFDLTAYGAWRKRVYRGDVWPILLPGHFGVAGVDLGPMWNVARMFRAGLSADLQWDGSTDLSHYHIEGVTTEDIRFARPPFLSQLSVGLSARAELSMPIFAVNVGIGYNFCGPGESRASYQMANLRLLLTPRFFLNIGYQLLNFKQQSNLRLGCGLTVGPGRNNSYRDKALSTLWK